MAQQPFLSIISLNVNGLTFPIKKAQSSKTQLTTKAACYDGRWMDCVGGWNEVMVEKADILVFDMVLYGYYIKVCKI